MTEQFNRILVVDDNPEILKDLSTLLALHQYQVDTTTSGYEAIRKLKNYAMIWLFVILKYLISMVWIFRKTSPVQLVSRSYPYNRLFRA